MIEEFITWSVVGYMFPLHNAVNWDTMCVSTACLPAPRPRSTVLYFANMGPVYSRDPIISHSSSSGSPIDCSFALSSPLFWSNADGGSGCRTYSMPLLSTCGRPSVGQP